MKELSQMEKEKILSRIFWDYQLDWHDLNEMLNGKPEDTKDIRRINLYRRLLTSCDWYTLIKLFSPEQMSFILDDAVLAEIYPKDLKNRYRYARNILSR